MIKLLVTLYLIFGFISSASAAWVFPDKTQDVTDDKVLLSTSWNAILIEAKTRSSTSLTGSAHLPIFSATILGGKTLKLDLNQFEYQAQVISTFVFFAGLLLSFFIIFS